MTSRTGSTPPAVLIFGLLGIIPFWSLPATTLLAPAWVGISVAVEAVYAALILSFLGGARWGLAVRGPSPNPMVVGLAMTPTLAGLVILTLTHSLVRPQLLALAAGLTLCWVWDVRAKDLPPWYRRFRSLLTLGAVTGLCVSVMLVPQ